MLLLPMTEYGYDYFHDTWYLLMTFWYAWNFVISYFAPTNQFYQLAHTGAQSLTRAFIFTDKIFSSKMIIPSKPWVRYA